MSKAFNYLQQLALNHTQKHGDASTKEILDEANVDLSALDDEDNYHDAIANIELNLDQGTIALCRAKVGGWPEEDASGATGDGRTPNMQKFLATGDRKFQPRAWPTPGEAEATVTRLNAMALARNDKNDPDAPPVPKTLDELAPIAYAKWNAPRKRQAAEE